MTNTIVTTALEVREDAAPDGVAAVLEGVAVPYGPSFDMGGVRESFAAGSFDPADVIGKPLCWRHGEPIGVIVDARNTDTGLWVRGHVADTTLGRDVATLARTRAATGLSVGFRPIEDAWNRTRDAVTRVRAALGELSVTHMPAYPDAALTTIREEPAMSDTDTMTAPDTDNPAPVEYATREDVIALRDRIASINTAPAAVTREIAPDDFYREFGTAIVKRAWTDLTLDGKAGDITPPPAGVSLWVDYNRPLVSAVGVDPLGDKGLDTAWILDTTAPTVSAMTGEKTAVASTVPAGSLVKAAVVTYAGGNDVSVEFIRRADVWDFPHVVRMYAKEYAKATNAAVATSMAAATQTMTIPATGLTSDVLGELLGIAAAQIVAGTGNVPTACVLDPALFFRVGLATGQGYPLAGGPSVGNADLTSLSFTALGLRFVCDPMITGGFLFDGEAIGVKESPGAPFDMSANVPSKLGVDYAVFGFMAHRVLEADGIVKIAAAAPATTK